jgi:hypothetical protein
MMGFLLWLENSGFADWIRSSFIGYPLVLTLHSIGMAIMVGFVFMLNLRLVGLFDRIPYSALSKMLGLAWVGFGINVLSGIAIFTSQASAYVSNVPFLIKIAAVFIGAGITGYMQPILYRESATWENQSDVPDSIKRLAIVSLSMWAVAIIMGRFTAYL